MDKYTKSSLNKFKEEVANQLGINLKPGDNGNLSARDAGRIGGEMVRRMVKAYQERLKWIHLYKYKYGWDINSHPYLHLLNCK